MRARQRYMKGGIHLNPEDPMDEVRAQFAFFLEEGWNLLLDGKVGEAILKLRSGELLLQIKNLAPELSMPMDLLIGRLNIDVAPSFIDGMPHTHWLQHHKKIILEELRNLEAMIEQIGGDTQFMEWPEWAIPKHEPLKCATCKAREGCPMRSWMGDEEDQEKKIKEFMDSFSWQTRMMQPPEIPDLLNWVGHDMREGKKISKLPDNEGWIDLSGPPGSMKMRIQGNMPAPDPAKMKAGIEEQFRKLGDKVPAAMIEKFNQQWPEIEKKILKFNKDLELKEGLVEEAKKVWKHFSAHMDDMYDEEDEGPDDLQQEEEIYEEPEHCVQCGEEINVYDWFWQLTSEKVRVIRPIEDPEWLDIEDETPEAHFIFCSKKCHASWVNENIGDLMPMEEPKGSLVRAIEEHYAKTGEEIPKAEIIAEMPLKSCPSCNGMGFTDRSKGYYEDTRDQPGTHRRDCPLCCGRGKIQEPQGEEPAPSSCFWCRFATGGMCRFYQGEPRDILGFQKKPKWCPYPKPKKKAESCIRCGNKPVSLYTDLPIWLGLTSTALLCLSCHTGVLSKIHSKKKGMGPAGYPNPAPASMVGTPGDVSPHWKDPQLIMDEKRKGKVGKKADPMQDGCFWCFYYTRGNCSYFREPRSTNAGGYPTWCPLNEQSREKAMTKKEIPEMREKAATLEDPDIEHEPDEPKIPRTDGEILEENKEVITAQLLTGRMELPRQSFMALATEINTGFGTNLSAATLRAWWMKQPTEKPEAPPKDEEEEDTGVITRDRIMDDTMGRPKKKAERSLKGKDGEVKKDAE